ncbi:MAG: hypothetical protein QM730_24815 [Anaerolineales bacterium]
MKLCKSAIMSLMIIIFSSCSQASGLEESPSILTPDIGVDNQNENYLQVTAPKGWNTYKNSEPISLEIQNISDKRISSGPDFGARIFVLTENGWVEVKNKVVYQKDGFILNPNENYVPERIAAIFVQPDLLDYSVPTQLRIYVIGNLLEDGKVVKEIASYVDIELNP